MGRFGRFLILVLLVSNLILLVSFLAYVASANSSATVVEKHHGGDANAEAKVALVRIEGTILEGFVGFAHQQIKAAAQDDQVKAVVLVVNSPGGSVTASDQLWKQIKDLRDGKWDHQAGPKPVVAAMASIAASGGYYVAAPAQTIVAEPTTITGSIGVYAPFLDVHQLAEKYGVAMNLIKKGELKASGSMFHPMTPEERIHWDEMLEAVYQRFMNVVKEGRDGQVGGKRLKYGLRDEIKLTSHDGKEYVRRLADGGIYTSAQALQYGLVDQIGYLDDAITEAKKLAGLTQANVVSYGKPATLADLVLGAQPAPAGAVRLTDVPGATARAWYLTPGYELTGVAVPARP
jgi:protease-4